MNQKCLTTIFVPVQPLNFNINPPSICQEHQKPLSYYNKYKPDNGPICLDCLINEAKEGKDFNLYLPFSNLEQEYYYQKNAFFQIIEQANNLKKYDAHITNFQHLLTNFFGQFISKFLKEAIFGNSTTTQKKVDFYDKNNACLNPKEIMNILNKVENEKYILENKCADVFSQINKLERILLKNHDKLEKSFKDLLYGFFDNSRKELYPGKDNLKDMQSNKRLNSIISIPSNSSQKSQDFLVSTKQSKNQNDENISQFSPIDELKGNFNNKFQEFPNFPENINLNMEKEKIFEENIEFEPEEEKKSTNSHNEINNSFSENKFPDLFPEKNKEKMTSNPIVEQELEWRKKKCDEEPLGWRRKSDDDDDICKEHKDKINKLIEQDKNKKVSMNQSFFQPKKSNFKKKSNLNKSFQKYNPAKFCFSKKIDYKQYNQFVQKTCKKCGSSFVTTKDDETCQNCKYISDDEEKMKRRVHRDFSNKNEKYRFFPKNFGGPKKSHMQTRIGNKKFYSKKNETSFNRQFNKTLIHSNSNFLNHHGNNRMNSPKGFDDHKRFNISGRYKLNKGNAKNNFGQKNYQQKRNNDDFEVDLESDDENNINDNDENDMGENYSNIEKTFFKTSKEFFADNSRKRIDEKSMDDIDSQGNKNNSDDNKSDDSFDKKELSEKEKDNEDINDDNGNNIDREGDNNEDDIDDRDDGNVDEHDDNENVDNDFEADF